MKHQPQEKLWATAQRYLDDQLTPPERLEFEALMSEDKEIQEMVVYFHHLDEQERLQEQTSPEISSAEQAFQGPIARRLHLISRNAQFFAVQHYVQHLLTETPPGQIPAFQLRAPSPLERWKAALRKSWRWLYRSMTGRAIIGAFLLLGLAGGLQMTGSFTEVKPQLTEHQQSLLTHLYDYPFPIGGGPGSPKLEQMIREDFLAGAYIPAREKIEQLLSQEENLGLREKDPGYYGLMQLHRAICLIRENRIERAVSLLRELNAIQADISTVEDQVITFYLAFALLLNGNKSEAEPLLPPLLGNTVKLAPRDPLDPPPAIGEIASSLQAELQAPEPFQ